jgi:hypothetical protein
MKELRSLSSRPKKLETINSQRRAELLTGATDNFTCNIASPYSTLPKNNAQEERDKCETFPERSGGF